MDDLFCCALTYLILTNEPLVECLALVGKHEGDLVRVDEEAGHGLALQLDALHQGRVDGQGEHLRQSGLVQPCHDVCLPLPVTSSICQWVIEVMVALISMVNHEGKQRGNDLDWTLMILKEEYGVGCNINY